MQIVVRVYVNLAVVYGPGIDIAHPPPGLAAVLASKNAAVLVFDDGIHNSRIAAIDAQAYAACIAGTGILIRKSASQLLPGCSAVRRLVDCAVRATAVEPKRGPAALVGRGIESIGILPDHGDIGNPHVFIYIKDVLPGAASVRRFENAALLVRPPKPPDRRHIDDIGIRRMNSDSPDVMRVRQTHFLPGTAGVRGFIDAVPPG